jgi:DHA2 family multidrug resistance protein
MLWAAAVILAAANFIAVLDMTIANVSVPNIAGSSAHQLEPRHLGHHLLRGGGGDHRPAHRVAGGALRRGARVRRRPCCCSAPSRACAASHNSLGMLVFGRIMQGLCGGLLMPLSQTLAAAHLPEGKGRCGHRRCGR